MINFIVRIVSRPRECPLSIIRGSWGTDRGLRVRGARGSDRQLIIFSGSVSVFVVSEQIENRRGDPRGIA